MRAIAPLLLAFAALGLAAASARAQNPEKFERVVPPKAQPAAPAVGDAAMRELIRMADARQSENGFCDRAKWPNRYTHEMLIAAAPAGGLVATKNKFNYSGDEGFQCSVYRISPEVSEGARRTRTLRNWTCESRRPCAAHPEVKLFRKAGPAGGWASQP